MKKQSSKPAHIIAAAAVTLISTSTLHSKAMALGTACEGSFVEQTQTSRLRQTMQNFGLFGRANGRTGKSQDQNTPAQPAIATMEQFKTALKTDTSALKDSHYRADENSAIAAFFNGNLLSLYQMIGRDHRELVDLIRLSGTPVTEKWVAGYRGESILQSDAPLKTVATVLRLNNATFPKDLEAHEIARNLNLNPSYVSFREGVLMVEEHSSSTSGAGIYNPGVSQPGLTDIRGGKVPGYSVATLSHDNALSQGSVWGGRYSETTVSAVVPMDAAKFTAARDSLGNQLVEVNLQVLATSRISDPSLNQWLDQVSKYTLKSMPWYKATTVGSPFETTVLKVYESQPSEFKIALTRFLFARRVLNLKPTVTYEHKSSSDPRFHLDGSIEGNIGERGKAVDTVSNFRVDTPFIRPGKIKNSLEVFGHLRASENPPSEMNADAVKAYIRKNIPEIFQRNEVVEITDIVVTVEGQFSANVTAKPKPGLIRRLLGRETN